MFCRKKIAPYFIFLAIPYLTNATVIDIGEREFQTTNTPLIKSLDQQNDRDFIPLKQNTQNLIDIRAYGDSGWSWTHESPAMDAQFGDHLDLLSPSGELYRGDLNFINWETTVGYTCEQWHAPYVRGRSYAFLARPENVEQALDRGIEFFALSTNHTRDCVQNIETGLNGQLSTLYYLEGIQKSYPNLVFHGTARENKNIIKEIKKIIKGKTVTIAFGSYYTGRAECPHSVCESDDEDLLLSFKKSTADLKILMIHTMSDQTKLAEVGKKFIEEADGDIVFGSGPHRWKPIRHVIKPNGENGIIFDSLGNFLHPSMAAQSKNIIARVLIDIDNFSIRQLQAISVRNEENKVVPSELSPTIIPSELNFKAIEIESDDQQFKAMYFNF